MMLATVAVLEKKGSKQTQFQKFNWPRRGYCRADDNTRDARLALPGIDVEYALAEIYHRIREASENVAPI